MKPYRGWIVMVMVIVLAVIGFVSPAQPQTDESPASQADGPTQTDPPQSADDVLQDLLDQAQPVEPIAPTRRPARPGQSAERAAAVAVDPAIIGTAPGDQLPTLRREGDFVRSRRGRLLRSRDGMHQLFVFDADDRMSPEPPMIMLPCQILQNMEDLVTDHSDAMVFTLSGQVTTYRGANYLLPTVMRPAVDNAALQ